LEREKGKGKRTWGNKIRSVQETTNKKNNRGRQREVAILCWEVRVSGFFSWGEGVHECPKKRRGEVEGGGTWGEGGVPMVKKKIVDHYGRVQKGEKFNEGREEVDGKEGKVQLIGQEEPRSRGQRK